MITRLPTGAHGDLSAIQFARALGLATYEEPPESPMSLSNEELIGRYLDPHAGLPKNAGHYLTQIYNLLKPSSGAKRGRGLYQIMNRDDGEEDDEDEEEDEEAQGFTVLATMTSRRIAHGVQRRGS